MSIRFLPVLFRELECAQMIVGGLEAAEDTLDASLNLCQMRNEGCLQRIFQIESVISAPLKRTAISVDGLTEQLWLNQWCKVGAGLPDCLTNGRWGEYLKLI